MKPLREPNGRKAVIVKEAYRTWACFKGEHEYCDGRVRMVYTNGGYMDMDRPCVCECHKQSGPMP